MNAPGIVDHAGNAAFPEEALRSVAPGAVFQQQRCTAPSCSDTHRVHGVFPRTHPAPAHRRLPRRSARPAHRCAARAAWAEAPPPEGYPAGCSCRCAGCRTCRKRPCRWPARSAAARPPPRRLQRPRRRPRSSPAVWRGKRRWRPPARRRRRSYRRCAAISLGRVLQNAQAMTCGDLQDARIIRRQAEQVHRDHHRGPQPSLGLNPANGGFQRVGVEVEGVQANVPGIISAPTVVAQPAEAK